jgi:hypothetical protein
MLRILFAGNAMPLSWPVHPSDEFEPGQVGQLKVLGNQVVCGVSDGTAPIGILDDMKKNAFTSTSIDEEIIVPATGRLVDGKFVSVIDLIGVLQHAAIVASSFISYNVDVELNSTNGIVTFPAGTELNYSYAGNTTLDGIRTIVSYTYFVPNIPGDDTTLASSQVTVWFQKMFIQTDQFETNRRYPINAPLFISEIGKFTTTPVREDYPMVALVTTPPTSIHGSLGLVWMG